jgi:hypothetical protein
LRCSVVAGPSTGAAGAAVAAAVAVHVSVGAAAAVPSPVTKAAGVVAVAAIIADRGAAVGASGRGALWVTLQPHGNKKGRIVGLCKPAVDSGSKACNPCISVHVMAKTFVIPAGQFGG